MRFTLCKNMAIRQNINMRTDSSTKRYHQTQTLNASTNGGDASRVGFLLSRLAELKQRLTDKRVISTVCEPLFSVLTLHFPDARRVAPISACVWCLHLVLASGGCVWCLRLFHPQLFARVDGVAFYFVQFLQFFNGCTVLCCNFVECVALLHRGALLPFLRLLAALT